MVILYFTLSGVFSILDTGFSPPDLRYLRVFLPRLRNLYLCIDFPPIPKNPDCFGINVFTASFILADNSASFVACNNCCFLEIHLVIILLAFSNCFTIVFSSSSINVNNSSYSFNLSNIFLTLSLSVPLKTSADKIVFKQFIVILKSIFELASTLIS